MSEIVVNNKQPDVEQATDHARNQPETKMKLRLKTEILEQGNQEDRDEEFIPTPSLLIADELPAGSNNFLFVPQFGPGNGTNILITVLPGAVCFSSACATRARFPALE